MKRILLCVIAMNILAGAFAQAPSGVDSIRDYVGLVSIADHPELIAFVNKIKDELKEESSDKPVPKEMPYERPVGSGFLVKAQNGNTYILTNWHVISFGWDFSITFERSLDQRTVYSGLVLLAADEDLDLALLAFAPGNRPDREGLPLLERRVWEGEEVYSAGFPALGKDPVWQLGRGQISNSQVMLHKYYDDDEDDTMEGPFIQHTSQVDPGNSGGPLLIADPSSPAGFTVAGVNAKSARRRQAANYSIPADTVRGFLNQVFNPEKNTEAEEKKLEERLRVFLKELKENRVSIFDWITYSCFLDNIKYAYYHYSLKNRNFRFTTNHTMNSIMNTFYEMTRETIPYIDSKKKQETKIISVEKDKDAYRVIFGIPGKRETVSRWEMEHGTWRIASVGKIDGDKAKIAKAEKLYYNQENIRDGFIYYDSYAAEAGYAQVLDRGGAFYGALGTTSAGLRGIFADVYYWQVEIFGRGYFSPLRFNAFALETNISMGMGIKYLPKTNEDDSGLRFGISPSAGLQLTSSAIPGFYIGAAYQYNLYFRNADDENNTRHIFIFMAGYRFKE